MIKKYLLTGVAILLPVIMTLWILSLMINFLTKPFIGFILTIFNQYNEQALALPSPILVLLAKILIVILLIGFTVLIGLVARWVFIHYFIQWIDVVVRRIPIVSSIYNSAKDVVNSLFSPTSPSFSQVVLIPFPNSRTLSIGLISKDEVPVLEKASKTDTVSVFVPGTPNPSVGFLLMFKKEQLIFTDMKVNEAMKFVISCAVMMPVFKILDDK